jgi:polyphosphate kinase
LEASDLLETMEESVRARRFGQVVRVTVNDDMPTHIREILLENLELETNDIITLEGPMGLGGLMYLYSIDRYDLKDPPFKQTVPAQLRTEGIDSNIFAAIRKGNILLHHPCS